MWVVSCRRWDEVDEVDVAWKHKHETLVRNICRYHEKCMVTKT